MKKIILLLIITLFSANCVFAKGLDMNKFYGKLKNKPTEQERLAPVKQIYDEELTPSEKAILLYGDNNLAASMDILMTIKESDRTAMDWLLIGNILQDQNKITDAIFMYQRAMSVNPKFYKSYYNLGNIYLEDEKPYLAIQNYHKVNALNNNFPYAYYNLGCAYLKIGDLKKAKIAFLKAIELKNTEPDFHYNLAYIYKMLKNEKLAKQYLGFYNTLMENCQ